MPTYFSDHFSLKRTKQSDWFDPVLGTDTRLFIDPFKIYAESSGFWANAHEEIIAYFQEAFQILAPVHDKPSAPAYKKVLQLMEFPEPRYFGLGFVADSQEGAGTSKGLAKRMVEAMAFAVSNAATDIRHFEELTLLVERIGRDRISDITCNILMPRFITYTQRVCRRLKVPLEPLPIAHGYFDEQRRRWLPTTADLPRNPITGAAVLLTPKRFLDELPQLNADDWFDFNAQELRLDFNLDVNERLSKEQIVQAARARLTAVAEWSKAAAPSDATPYDVDKDPVGLHNWLAYGKAFAEANPLTQTAPTTTDEMMKFVEECILRFQHFVEQGSGWSLLYNDDSGRPKREESIQLLFKGVVESYCENAEIRLDRETYVGRGPVDFIFTKTASLRVLLEIKKMSNSSYWDGLEVQLTTYMTADKTEAGWFLPVRLSDSQTEEARHLGLATRVAEVRASTGFDIRAIAVDARRPKSASKVKKGS